MENKDYVQALSFIEPALMESPDNLALHMLKIKLDATKNNPDLMLNDYEKLVASFPDNDSFKYALVKLSYKGK